MLKGDVFLRNYLLWGNILTFRIREKGIEPWSLPSVSRDAATSEGNQLRKGLSYDNTGDWQPWAAHHLALLHIHNEPVKSLGLFYLLFPFPLDNFGPALNLWHDFLSQSLSVRHELRCQLRMIALRIERSSYHLHRNEWCNEIISPRKTKYVHQVSRYLETERRLDCIALSLRDNGHLRCEGRRRVHFQEMIL